VFKVHFVPNEKGNPPGKLADVELHFTDIEQDCPTCQGRGETECPTCEGKQTIQSPFGGLKLIGFSIWERRGGGRNVTFPARQYSVNGERRSFALLRPIVDATAQERIRDLILEAFARFEEVGR
jgi:hypothetical protein